jgi:hypothetical protein
MSLELKKHKLNQPLSSPNLDIKTNNLNFLKQYQIKNVNKSCISNQRYNQK